MASLEQSNIHRISLLTTRLRSTLKTFYTSLPYISQVFTMVDQDGDGAITKKDLQSLLTSLGVTDVTEETLMEMLTQANGTLNFTAFLAMFAHMTSDMDSDEVWKTYFFIFNHSILLLVNRKQRMTTELFQKWISLVL